MEQSVEQLKAMVYETLLESKKPIKSKTIALNIRSKYDGFKMSRFMLRDILWKEMKGLFEYDNQNYTFWIDSEQLKINEGVSDSNKKSTNLTKTFQNPENFKFDELLKKIGNFEQKNILQDFQNLIKSNYLNVNTGNKKFDQLISVIVKDNKITPNEEAFLKQKTLEFDLPYSLIEKAKEMLNSNNPFLDNIIHIIFEDGKITEEELLFLKEKEIENDFSKSFVNQRFWQIGISYYLKELNQLNNFDKIIKLWHIGNILDFSLINIDTWLILKLDIHSYNKIDEIINKSIEVLEDHLKKHVSEKYRIYNDQLLEYLYSEINVDNQKEEPLKIKIDNRINDKVIKIIEQEKMRIGDPASNLLAENIKFRLENKEWD